MAKAEAYKAVKSESGDGWDVVNTEFDSVAYVGLTEQEAKDKAALLNEMLDEVNTEEAPSA